MFLDENEVAQRNSARARRGPREDRVVSGPTQLLPGTSTAASYQAGSDELSLVLRRQLYSWLNDRALAEVPGPLKRDLDTRAIERFFHDWTLHPSNDGVSPG